MSADQEKINYAVKKYLEMLTQQAKMLAVLQPEEQKSEGDIDVQFLCVADAGEPGEWAIVALPLMADAEGNVTLPDSMPHDLHMTMYATPAADDCLSHKFNVQGLFLAEGFKAEPLVVLYKPPPGEGEQAVHLSVSRSKDGNHIDDMAFALKIDFRRDDLRTPGNGLVGPDEMLPPSI